MIAYALVHGFGAGFELEHPSYIPKSPLSDSPSTRYHEFLAFKELIDSGRAELFQWQVVKKSGIFRFAPTYISLYKEEQKLTKSPAVLQALDEFFKKHQPEVIVGHSMAAQLICNYLEKYNLPDSVQLLAFVQADIGQNPKIENQDIQQRIAEKQLSWVNYFCPTDYTLYFSSGLNRRMPAGLRGIKHPLIKDQHFNLDPKVTPVLHVSSIGDPKFLAELEKAKSQI